MSNPHMNIEDINSSWINDHSPGVDEFSSDHVDRSAIRNERVERHAIICRVQFSHSDAVSFLLIHYKSSNCSVARVSHSGKKKKKCLITRPLFISELEIM